MTTDEGASVLNAELDANSWEANVRYLLDSCPYTVWQCPGGGAVDLKSTLAVTFRGMQMRLAGDPMFGKTRASNWSLI
jgi:hypothetical protein